jgi:hypothetical protein
MTLLRIVLWEAYLVNHLQEVSHEHKGQNVPVKLAKQLLVVHCNADTS